MAGVQQKYIDVSFAYLTLTGPSNFGFYLPTACYSATNFMFAH